MSWTYFIALIPLKDPIQRHYYGQIASAERWSVQTLRERIDAMLSAAVTPGNGSSANFRPKLP